MATSDSRQSQTKNRKLETAFFAYGQYEVLFQEDTIEVWDHLNSPFLMWKLPNKWTSREKENPSSVTGRYFKPRNTDASKLLNLALGTEEPRRNVEAMMAPTLKMVGDV